MTCEEALRLARLPRQLNEEEMTEIVEHFDSCTECTKPPDPAALLRIKEAVLAKIRSEE